MVSNEKIEEYAIRLLKGCTQVQKPLLLGKIEFKGRKVLTFIFFFDP